MLTSFAGFPAPSPQESGFARQSEEWESASEAGIAAMREEAEILQNTLREITHAVRQDADTSSRLFGSPGPEIEVVDASLLEAEDDWDTSKRPISPSRAARVRSTSPTRARSPAHSDNALGMVHSAIRKKNMQVQVKLPVFQFFLPPFFFPSIFLGCRVHLLKSLDSRFVPLLNAGDERKDGQRRRDGKGDQEAVGECRRGKAQARESPCGCAGRSGCNVRPCFRGDMY